MDQSRDKRKKLIMELFHDDLYVPMRRKELAIFMQVDDSIRSEFDSVVDELINEGSIIVTGRGKLIANDKHDRKSSDKQESARTNIGAYVGKFTGNQKGFGFVTVEGIDNDFFIPEDCTLNAMHGDTVEIIPSNGKQRGERKEARIVRIVERSEDIIVGTYEASKNFGFVVADNKKIAEDIFIAKENSKGAVTGHKVIVKLTNYGDCTHKPEGVVTEIIGHINDPGVDILAIIKAFGIEPEFPEKVLNQAETVAKPVSEADCAGRLDLRDTVMVTIDGEDAKDLDDAVSLEMEGEFYKLGVHIADVSNYVQERSQLDREAYKRGTSVYLADRVVPMLPHILSNGICSLNQGEDRLAMSCIMKIDANGDVKDYGIYESVVNINRRMSYTEVNKVIADHDEKTMALFPELVPMFEKMQELSLILRNARRKRGAIDFDFPETKMVLDEKGVPIAIKPYERNEATRLIESFMLIANETVATHCYWAQMPFLYRIHEAPDEEKVEKLKTFVRNFGYVLKTGNDEVHPKELQKLLGKIEGTPEEALIARITLRSMKQAKYSEECSPHFGLASKYYTHFTSPIRRYPDLQIHRIIKDSLRGRLPKKEEHYNQILPDVAKQTSERERRADEAERETIKLKKAQYMQNHMYEIFDGVISGVTNWGIYVELENTVEGLVHVSTLVGDYYVYDETNYELVGQDSGKKFKLGERIKVMVNNVDISTRTVDFIVADFEENSPIHNFYLRGRNDG